MATCSAQSLARFCMCKPYWVCSLMKTPAWLLMLQQAWYILQQTHLVSLLPCLYMDIHTHA